MRNFILIIRRFFNLILFALLEIVSIVLIARSRTIQGDDIISSSNAVAGIVYKKKTDLFYYMNLGSMNDSLLSENMRLRKIVDALHSVDTLKDFTVQRALPTKDTSVHVVQYASYVYRTARVIDNQVDNVNNYITINRGLKDGIAKGMSVISGNGLVGRVEYVSQHFASVLSILNTNKYQVSARLKDGTFKSTNWDNERPDVLVMKEMPAEAKVKKGDSVFTTSYGNTFPPDVLIGTVTSVEINKKSGRQQIMLKPATNFRNLQYVYVLDNQMEVERKQLTEPSNKKP